MINVATISGRVRQPMSYVGADGDKPAWFLFVIRYRGRTMSNRGFLKVVTRGRLAEELNHNLWDGAQVVCAGRIQPIRDRDVRGNTRLGNSLEALYVEVLNPGGYTDEL